MSKILERLALFQILVHLEQNNHIPDSAHGFRKGRSTTTALLCIKEAIQNALNNKEVAILTCLDFSKAFETIDHSVLIDKLRSLDFHRTTLRWLTSYLSDRDQFVQYNDNISEKLTATFGVPQGTILGPVLFTIYALNLPHYINHGKCIQYADDTQMIHTCKPAAISNTLECVSSDIKRIKHRCKDENLILNRKKCNFMIFASKNMYSKYNITANHSEILVDDEIKFSRKDISKILGVTFDSHLSFSSHITETLKKCYSTLSVLKKIRNFCDFKTRKLLCECIIFPKLDYCTILLYAQPQYLNTRIDKLLKILASFVTKHFASQFDLLKLKWPCSSERRDSLILKNLYLYAKNPFWPTELKSILRPQVHQLRNNECLFESGTKGSFQNIVSNFINVQPPPIRKWFANSHICAGSNC